MHNQLWLCSIIEIVRHTYARCCDTWHYYSLIRKRNAHHPFLYYWTDYISFSKIHEFLNFNGTIILFLSDKNLIQNVLDCYIVGGKNGEIVQWIMIVWLAARAKLLLGLNKCVFFSFRSHWNKHLLLLRMALFSYFFPMSTYYHH